MYDKLVVAQFEEKTKTAVDNNTCIQCVQKIMQQGKELIRNERLQRMFKAQLASQASPSIDSECFVNVREILKSNLFIPEAYSDVNCGLNELINILPSDPLLIKVIKVPTQYHDVSAYNDMKRDIEGATWVRREGESDGHMTIKHDDNECDATVVLFEQPPTLATDTNFIILQNIDVKEVDVTNISKQEQIRIDKGVTASRPGPAGGYSTSWREDLALRPCNKSKNNHISHQQ